MMDKKTRTALLGVSLLVLMISLALFYINKKSSSKLTESEQNEKAALNGPNNSSSPNSSKTTCTAGAACSDRSLSSVADAGKGGITAGGANKVDSSNPPTIAGSVKSGGATGVPTGGGLNTSGTNITSGTNTAAKPGENLIDQKIASQDQKQQTPEIPKNSCIVMSFKHKKLKGHKDLDDCSTHKNVIEFKTAPQHPELPGKNVCIRVDGTAVKFQTQKTKWILGPVAGPESVISVRYCPAGITQNCPVPKDAFIEAIGGEDGDTGQMVNWDGSKEGDKSLEVDGEVSADFYPEESESNGLSLFTGWVEESTKYERGT